MATPSGQQRGQRRSQVIGFGDTRGAISLPAVGIEDKRGRQRQNRKTPRSTWIFVQVDLDVCNAAEVVADLVDHAAHLGARSAP